MSATAINWGGVGWSKGTQLTDNPIEPTAVDHTSVLVDNIQDPALRELMFKFGGTSLVVEIGQSASFSLRLARLADVNLTQLIAAMDSPSAVRPSTAVEDHVNETLPVVRVVEELAAQLDVPVRDILRAASVSHRTFYFWKARGVRQPRLESQGRLWELVNLVSDWREDLDEDVGTWIRSDPKRVRALRKGDLSLLAAYAAYSSLSIHEQPTSEFSIMTSTGGVGEIDFAPRLGAHVGGGRSRPARRIGTNSSESDNKPD